MGSIELAMLGAFIAGLGFGFNLGSWWQRQQREEAGNE